MVYYSILLFFVFDYLRPGNFVPGLDLLKLNSFVPMFAVLGTAFGKTPVSNRQFLSDPNTKIIGTLLLMMIVSTVFAAVTMTASDVTKNVFAYMLIYWVLVRQMGDVGRLRSVFATLILVHITIAVLSPEMFTTPDGRTGLNAAGFLGDGNDYALSVSICVPLCIFVLSTTKAKMSRIFWIAAMCVLLLAVVATKSRGGTLALASVGLYYWVKSQRKVLTAAVTVIAVLAVLAIAPPLWFERMGTIGDTEESSAQGRLDAWKHGFQMALDNPLIGVGPGHFPMTVGQMTKGPWLTAHSIYFLLLGELGFPGLMWLLVVIGTNMYLNRRAQRDAIHLPRDEVAMAKTLLTCLSAALLAFAVGGAFLSAAYYPHIYVLCGFLSASRRIVYERIEETSRVPAERQDSGRPLLARPRLTPGRISPEWVSRPGIGPARRPA